ncbi:MAG TPA: hypothetical protein VFN30_01950 [Chitinophagaceae bacterium]|nr:hypothetical protein [Chitinophagaceae bacterium]
MRIFDCFTFFNELDLLELRIKLLDNVVDYFVVVESNLTHTGKEKPYYFETAKERFSKWNKKIIYIPITQSVEGLVFEDNIISYTPTSTAWQLENYQRNSLSAINHLVSDNDKVLVGDLDEIPNPFILKKLQLPEEPLVFSMLFHYYFLNCQNVGEERWWGGSVISNGKFYKQTAPQTLRDNRNQYKRIKKAGWHFSYLGGIEKIKYKIQSFAHTEYNKKEYLEDERIFKAITEGKDLFGRPGIFYKFYSPYWYPSFLRKIMLEYPSLIHYKKEDNFIEKIYYSLSGKFQK